MCPPAMHSVLAEAIRDVRVVGCSCLGRSLAWRLHASHWGSPTALNNKNLMRTWHACVTLLPAVE
jgi:hypothetical protein